MEFTIVAFLFFIALDLVYAKKWLPTHRQMQLGFARWLEWISQSALRRFSASDSFHDFVAIQKQSF